MKHFVTMAFSALMMTLMTASVWAEEILLIAPSPKTGDRMNMPLMIGLIAVAVVAIIVVVIMMIRNNKKQ